jgi:hypothetical protein
VLWGKKFNLVVTPIHPPPSRRHQGPFKADYMADDADDQTSDRFLEVYLLWLFG